MSYYSSGSGRDPEINAAVSDLNCITFRLSHQYIPPTMARGAFTREIASKTKQIIRIYEHGNIEKTQALYKLKNLGWKLQRQGYLIAQSGLSAVAAMMQQHRGSGSLDALHLNRYSDQTPQTNDQTDIDNFSWSHMPHARENSLLRYAVEAYFKQMKPAEKAEQRTKSSGSGGAGGGGSSSSKAPEPAPEPKKLTVKERLAKQRQQNLLESDKAFETVEAKKKVEKQAQQKSATPKEKSEEEPKGAFSLGWMQTELPMSQGDLWDSVFTSETTEKHKVLIKKHNVHLNEPVVQGELVIMLTREPETDEEQQQLDALKEEVQAGSEGLGKLDEAQAATVYRHFELLDYYFSKTLEYIQNNGLPSDEYAYTSIGVGAIASGIEAELNHVNGILLEINDLYVEQVAMASRVGGINYGTFVAQRAELLQRLDIPFARFATRTVKIPILRQIRRSLKLSTKSVIYNADEIIAEGIVSNLGKRMANISHGVWTAKGVGYLGLGLAVASGVKNIYDACSVDGNGECSKTVAKESVGFFAGLWGGIKGGEAGAALAYIALGVIGVTSAPIVAVSVAGGVILGGIAGGMLGTTAGKAFIDKGYTIYEKTIDE